MKSRERWNEAATKLAEVVNDEAFVSLAGKGKHALWLELCVPTYFRIKTKPLFERRWPVMVDI